VPPDEEWPDDGLDMAMTRDVMYVKSRWRSSLPPDVVPPNVFFKNAAILRVCLALYTFSRHRQTYPLQEHALVDVATYGALSNTNGTLQPVMASIPSWSKVTFRLFPSFRDLLQQSTYHQWYSQYPHPHREGGDGVRRYLWYGVEDR